MDSQGNQRAEMFMILQAIHEANHSVPMSRSEAKKSPEWKFWHKAEGEEMQSLTNQEKPISSMSLAKTS